jgi:hypothetical protein
MKAPVLLLITIAALLLSACGVPLQAEPVQPALQNAKQPTAVAGTPSSAALGQAGADTAAATPSQPTPSVSINFAAGIPLDPFFISLQGGGPVDASTLDKSCVGWTPAAPSVVFDFQGAASERLKLFMYSDHDPTLVVKTPDGKFVCNDNTNPLLLDPTVTIEKPKLGTYSVWAGHRTKQGLVAGLLVITAKPGVDLGTFRPGELVKRPSIPETLVAPRQDPGNAERLKQAMAAVAATAPRVKPGDPDTTVAFVADGKFSPITYLHDDLRCNGLIKLESTYVFSLTETIPNLRIFVEGNHDSNLIVKTPTGEPAYACNDDATGENFNPVVDLAKPAAGLYAVWVGRVNADEPVTGDLTITQSNRQPKALKDR